MLLEFLARNYRSIKDEVRLSMVSSRVRELADHRILLPLKGKKLYVNKLGVLFGPNASGKTNILRAILDMGAMVENLGIGRKKKNILEFFYRPFALDKTNGLEPTLFQASYIARQKYYRYGFKFDKRGILEEWLFGGTPGREAPLILRALERLEFINKSLVDDKAILEKQLAPENLVLPVGADLKIPAFVDAASFFGNIQEPLPKNVSLGFLDESLMEILSELLVFADTGISKIERIPGEAVELPPKNLPKNEKVEKIFELFRELQKEIPKPPDKIIFRHTGANANGNECVLNEDDESRGTQAFLRLLHDFCNALQTGSILVIDEIDESLHPLLLARALQFFASFDSVAQVICASHSPVIFSTRVLRRDELMVTEKDNTGGTFLHRASDFKDARNDGNLTIRYLEGRFGGVPLFNDKHMTLVTKKLREYFE